MRVYFVHPSPSSIPAYEKYLNMKKQCNISYTSVCLKSISGIFYCYKNTFKNNGLFVYLNKFLAKTMLNTKNQKHVPLINHIMNLSHKPCSTLMNQKHICLINHVIDLLHKACWKLKIQKHICLIKDVKERSWMSHKVSFCSLL